MNARKVFPSRVEDEWIGKTFLAWMTMTRQGKHHTVRSDLTGLTLLIITTKQSVTFYGKMYGKVHCWKILLILVLGKVASKTQYSHFVICKVWVLGFTHHFTLHPLIWQIFSLISWLYFSTMWILWGRKCDYWVFHITHAKKGLPNHSSSTRDLKDFFSICDVENTILTYPPHSILSLPSKNFHYHPKPYFDDLKVLKMNRILNF